MTEKNCDFYANVKFGMRVATVPRVTQMHECVFLWTQRLVLISPSGQMVTGISDMWGAYKKRGIISSVW